MSWIMKKLMGSSSNSFLNCSTIFWPQGKFIRGRNKIVIPICNRRSIKTISLRKAPLSWAIWLSVTTWKKTDTMKSTMEILYSNLSPPLQFKPDSRGYGKSKFYHCTDECYMLISYHLTYEGIGIKYIGAQISYPVNVERNLHWNAWRRILV